MGDGVTVYSKAGATSYDSMFKVANGGKLTIGEGVTLSGKTSTNGTDATCPNIDPEHPDTNTYTADKFTGKVSDDGTTYEPKGFFIQVEGGGLATLNGTISDFVTSRDKEYTPRYVAPVVANGEGATFNIGDTGVIKNNLVGYIVDDNMANSDAQSIKQYVKGAGPNVPRVPNAATQKANAAGFDRTRNKDAIIDEGVPGSGITATAGAVIYKGGARGSVTGTVANNRADTGGIMVSGYNTEVTLAVNEDTGKVANIYKNVGVQFGGGTTVEQGGEIFMSDGEMYENVAWFGGGAVYATENGVDWLQGRMNGADGLHPQFDDRLDGNFVMFGGNLHDNTALTRGGAILADSDAVQIAEGKLQNNMSRMLGGAVYVMGDHPLYTYTMTMTGLYVHDNTAVSGVVPGEKTAENDLLQTRLNAPSACADSTSDTPLFSGRIEQNTDDMQDGTGTHGTGGGLWLCAYGNTVFSAGATDKVVIANNYATGTAPLDNPVYNSYVRTGKDDNAKRIREDIAFNSAPSTATQTGLTGGQDIHADTGDSGTVVIEDLEHYPGGWIDENASTEGTDVPYETEVSDRRINLVNNGDKKTLNNPKVEVSGNIARRGGGLAADGTYILGEPGDQASIESSMQLAKSWGQSTAKEPVIIHVDAVTAGGKKAPVADVPLDGVANPPVSEFDTVQELVPTGNTWNGRFSLPLQLTAEDGSKIHVFTLTLNYEGLFENETINLLSKSGKDDLAKLIKAIKFDNTVDNVLDLDAVNADLREAVTINFNDSLHFECTEYDAEGNLKNTYVFTHDQVDLDKVGITLQSTDHTEKVWDPETQTYVDQPVYQSHIFGMNLSLSMTNDDQPIVEKYVNKDVHADIVNFDQDFEYDVLAYVPLSATEFTLADTLVQGLEFADKDGNPTTDPKKAIRSITVKAVNNHQPGKEGTVSLEPVKDQNGNSVNYMAFGGQYLPAMSIEGQTLSATFAKGAMNTDVFTVTDAKRYIPGRWVQLTFGARIKDEYRNIEALKALQANVDGKDTSWEDTATDKRGTPLRTVSYENGDLGLVSALLAEVGPDQPLWIGIEKRGTEGRLFAKSVNDKYFVITKADYRAGEQWILLSDSTETYDGATLSSLLKEAKGRYSGTIQSVRAVDATNPSDGDKGWVDRLAEHPAIVGGKIVKAVEGGTRLFAQTTDAGDTTHIFATPNNDKSGGTWDEITEADGKVYENAIARLKPDRYTVRTLDLTGTTYTLDESLKNWPVISEEEHEGMANQAAYSVKFGNNAEGTYKTNTVTVKPETTKLDVVKRWTGASDAWPEAIQKVVFGIYAKKGDTETPVYVKDGKVVPEGTEGAEPLTVELTADDPNTDLDESKATVSDLPKLKGVRYIAREIQINDEVVAYDGTKTFGSVLTEALSVLGEMSGTFKDARFATVAAALEEGDRALVGAENGGKLYVKTADGRYYVADANGDEAPAAWTEIAQPAEGEESADYTAVEKLFAGEVNGVTPADLTEVFTATNSQPAIEKYVNKKVHAELEYFDSEFEYDIMAYVPAGSTKVVLSDELKPQLDLVSKKADIEASAVSKDENDHTVESSVKAQGDPVAASATVGEKAATGTKVEVTIENQNHALDGKWVQVTLTAKINKDAYNAVAKKLLSDDVASAQADINWAKIVENTPVLGGDATHSGLVNKASYKVYVGENGSSDYESNEVTVKPTTTKLEVAKTWQDGTAEWPEDVTSITVGLFTLRGQDEAIVNGTIADNGTFTGGGDTQATYTLTADKNAVTITGLPRLKDVTYFAQELKIDDDEVDNGATYGVVRIGDIVKFVVSRIDETVSSNEGDYYKTTVNNEKVEVEKYVNNDVHADLVEFDKVFKYDVMVYVPKGTTEVVINDPLVDALEFAKVPANGDLNAKAEKAGQASESVASVVAKDKNDHTVGGTVKAEGGTPVTPSAMNIVGNTLTVKFVDVTAETGIQGKWVQVTFYAKYTDEIIKAATIGDTKTITDNGAVLGGAASHEGTPNKATASFTVGNEATFDLDTNEVTVNPETIQLYADKKWQDKNGNALTEWPQGAKVTFALMNGENEVASVVMDKAGRVSFPVQPKLVGVTYTVVEKSVEGVNAEQLGTPTVSDDGTTTFTNKLAPDKHKVIFSKQEFGDDTKELPGAEIVIKDSEGNKVDEWTSTDKPHELNLEAGEYTFEEVNAPKGFDKITTTVTFTVGEDGKVTLKEAYENINGKVSVAEINHLILEDMPTKHEVIFSKQEFGDDTKELPGAEIKVYDSEGNVVDEWTSTDKPHELNLTEGEYTFIETNAPKGFKVMTTTITFKVDSEGNVTIEGATEDDGGRVSVIDANHLILEDKALELTELQVVKTWKNNSGWSVATPEGLWPEGVTVAITVTDSEGTVVGTDTLSADHRAATFKDLPEGTTYTVTEEVSDVVAAVEDPKTVRSGETVEFVNELLPHKSKSAIEVLKVDEATGEALAGAGLQIVGKADDGTEVDITWTSGTEARAFELKAGNYTLKEVAAPVGYFMAEDIAFSIDEPTGQLMIGDKPADGLVVTMRDKPKPPPETPQETPGETPTPEKTSTAPTTPKVRPATAPLSKTGSSTGYPFALTAVLLGAGAGLLLVRRRKA